MIVSVASGKGGTGKTTVAVNLAVMAHDSGVRVCLADCDVEEPNCHLFFKEMKECPSDSRLAVSIAVPKIDSSLCTGCALCSDFCEFNALATMKQDVLVFPELCHGCGGCWLICPQEAISEVPRNIGFVRWHSVEGFPFIEGRLNIGEPMAPPVIKSTFQAIPDVQLAIVDGPPGTSCPMVETVKESDLVLLVAEPTPFGLNDLRLAASVIKELSIPAVAVINKSGSRDCDIEAFCAARSIPIIGKIPDSREMAQNYARGDLLCRSIPETKEIFASILNGIMQRQHL